jgi:hypothetical protein
LGDRPLLGNFISDFEGVYCRLSCGGQIILSQKHFTKAVESQYHCNSVADLTSDRQGAFVSVLGRLQQRQAQQDAQSRFEGLYMQSLQNQLNKAVTAPTGPSISPNYDYLHGQSKK